MILASRTPALGRLDAGLERAGEVDPVEAEDDVGLLDRRHQLVVDERRRRADVQRMIGRKGRADLEVGADLGAERLGERDARRPGLRVARQPAGEDQRMLGGAQHRDRLAHPPRGPGPATTGGMKRVDVDRRQRLGELRLLHLGVEVDVDGALRRRVGDPPAAQDALAGGARRGRLVVPLGVVAHQRALVARGVDPVDPGPPLDGVDRAGGAQDHDRHAVAPGVEDRHGAVHQADIGMHRRRHRAARDLGVAVRDRDRGLLVQAEQHLRRRVAEIIDQAVVQAAIARAGIERDVGDVEVAQGLGHHVAAEARRVAARLIRPLDRRDLGMRGIACRCGRVTSRLRHRSLLSAKGENSRPIQYEPAPGRNPLAGRAGW